jgi:hypothetical protein
LIALTRSNWSAVSSAASDHDPGVVESHVQPAELADGPFDHGGNLFLVRDIAGHRDHVMSSCVQLLRRRVERLLIEIGERHPRARLREGAGGREAHARAGPGDQRGLAAKVIGRVHGDHRALPHVLTRAGSPGPR